MMRKMRKKRRRNSRHTFTYERPGGIASTLCRRAEIAQLYAADETIAVQGCPADVVVKTPPAPGAVLEPIACT